METKKVRKENLIRELLNKLRYFHNHLKNYELDHYGNTSYSMLQSWLLDVIQYGTILYLGLLSFGLIKPIYWIIGLGISYWFILHEIKQIRKVID
jgi:hypothetical protein